MLFEFDNLAKQKANLKVVGIGGAGGNAVNRMIQSGMEGVEFCAINTDAQDLDNNTAPKKLQIGKSLTKGLGAGAKSELGRQAIESDAEAVRSILEGADMVFITAGMGGGTGTGAAPLIAQMTQELNILTVGIVTLPFNFEGPKRMARALGGITDMRKVCDTLIVIPNQKLMSIVGKDTTLIDAFQQADLILHQATKGISDLINVHGMINLDFADVETIMKNMGEAIMGTGFATGEERAVLAAQQAISSPLLDNASISGAQGVLVNITGGENLTLHEVDEATSIIFEEAGNDANIIFGAVIDSKLQEEIRVTVIATGFNKPQLIEESARSEAYIDTPRLKDTRILTEQMNMSLHDQKAENETQQVNRDQETSKPKIQFDDTNPNIHGNSIDIPAFIRRQHE
ncbi:MAG: cell division protein FtsZ [Candidatus Neomarinimicrobiota bacterium]